MKLLLVGLLCLAVGAAGAWLAWRSVQDVRTVWAAARSIAVGQVITSDDVTAVDVVLGQGARAVPATQPVAGQVALSDIPAGAIVAPESLGQQVSGGAGQVLMAVVVPIGAAPVAALAPGTPVTLLGPSGYPVRGVVDTAPALLPDGTHYRLDVRLDLTDASRLAQWVADGTVVVVTP